MNRLKLTAVIAFFILLASFFVYLIITTPTSLVKMEAPEKVVMFKNARLTGYEKGKESWEIFAEAGWTTKAGDLTTLENILDGKVYEDGRLIAKNIRAKKAKIYKYSRDIEVLREDGILMMDIDFRAKGGEKRYARIVADHLKYNPQTKKSEWDGNIEIREKGRKVFCEKLLVDHKVNLATLLKTKLITPSSSLRGYLMKIDFNNDISSIEGNVVLKEEGKVVTARSGIYRDKTKTITLISSVKAILERGGAIISEEAIAKLKNPEAKTLLGRTILTADRLELANDKNAIASGHVTVIQKDRKAISEYARYSNAENKIVLTEGVFMQKGSNWIKAKKVIVSVKEETFEAIGEVETQFKFKK